MNIGADTIKIGTGLANVWSGGRPKGKRGAFLCYKQGGQAFMLRIVRWVLMIPAALAAWFVALFLGIAMLGGLTRLCPPDRMVSGMCTASWYDGATSTVVAFGAAMAAVFIMIACTLIAPAHKRVVAVVTFAGGALVAASMGLPSGEYAALIAAVVAGAVVLWILLRRLGASARQVAENPEKSEKHGIETTGI